MTFKYRYRKQIGIGIMIVFVLCATGIGIYKFYPDKQEETKVLVTKKSEKYTENKKDITREEAETIMVDIKGYVNQPGIYQLKENSRVIDQTCPIMIQRLRTIFQRNPLISMGI